ncbi:fumarate hydrolyase [PVC group bacterium (ex Bugula neritina AB1)]|nr:fumarate hydrolyase [PVC group bacterium (ex Bugula neritina AB1)]
MNKGLSKKISLPIDDATIRTLRIGDNLEVSGTIVTARDMAHKFMVKESPSFLKPLLKNTFIYHCGPVIRKESNGYRFLAAGPTTSIREEPYQDKVIKDYQVRGVIGKGGMGAKTLKALQEHGAVYLHATGGAAPLLAQHIISVKDVHMLDEFGVPEAMWVIEVKDFPVLVTMDTTGASLHAELIKSSSDLRDKLMDTL